MSNKPRVFKIVYSILGVVILCACGGRPTPPEGKTPMPVYSVENELVPYVALFESEFNVHIMNIKIQFDPLNSEQAGYCSYYNGLGTILINSTYWQQITATYREVLIFHELGHCFLNQDHREGILPDGCPLSIMDPENFGGRCYQIHRKEYLDEMRAVGFGNWI